MLLSDFRFFFFIDTATTDIYTLSLHDALPISLRRERRSGYAARREGRLLRLGLVRDPRLLPRSFAAGRNPRGVGDRKSTRLNSSHVEISYAVFCLKKKKIISKPFRCYQEVLIV